MDEDKKTTQRSVSPIRFTKEYLAKKPYLSDAELKDLEEIVKYATGLIKKKSSSCIMTKTNYGKNKPL
jgi:hypothetical protein